jgi:hypothetical protein
MKSKSQRMAVFLALASLALVACEGCASTRRTATPQVQVDVNPKCKRDVSELASRGGLSEKCARDLLYNLHASLKR